METYNGAPPLAHQHCIMCVRVCVCLCVCALVCVCGVCVYKDYTGLLNKPEKDVLCPDYYTCLGLVTY